MKRAREAPNLLELRPARLVAHGMEEQRVVLLIPRFRARWLAWLQRRLPRPYIRVRLDEVGSAVWLRADGLATAYDIGSAVQAQFGAAVEPIWPRLGLFLQQLRRGGLIRLLQEGESPPADGPQAPPAPPVGSNRAP